MAETPFVPPTSTAYSSVFTLVRDWLGLAGLGADAPVLDSLARNIAADMCNRDLAPAAYGDKRRPYYTHACAGVEGMSATLHLRDGSLELVFKDEEMNLVREEDNDLHVAHIEASEVLALRQWLIDFLPASEVKISSGFGVSLPVSVAVPAHGSEERHFWLEAAEQHGFEATSGEEELPAFDPPAYLATEEEVLKLMAVAREQGRKDVLDALAIGGERITCAARRQGTIGGNDPADCDWPVCGCDPYADKVIAALQESGALAMGGARHG